MVVLQAFGSREEAEVVRALLASENIASYIHADDQNGLRPSLAFAHGVQLMVNADDLELAKRVLEAALR